MKIIINSIILYILLTIIIIVSVVFVWPLFLIKNINYIFKKTWWIWLIVLFLLGWDIFTKNLAIKYLKFNDPIVVTNFFSLEYIENTGAAFGILPNKQYLFIFIAIIACIFFLILAVNGEKILPKIAYVFLLAGAIGNLYDRFKYGFVIDFLNLKGFPVFNLSDLFINLGILIIFYRLFTNKEIGG